MATFTELITRCMIRDNICDTVDDAMKMFKENILRPSISTLLIIRDCVNSIRVWKIPIEILLFLMPR